MLLVDGIVWLGGVDISIDVSGCNVICCLLLCNSVFFFGLLLSNLVGDECVQSLLLVGNLSRDEKEDSNDDSEAEDCD
jgi:hypothetical protein